MTKKFRQNSAHIAIPFFSSIACQKTSLPSRVWTEQIISKIIMFFRFIRNLNSVATAHSKSLSRPTIPTATLANHHPPPSSSSSSLHAFFRCRGFSTSPIRNATYNQVRRGCRVAQRARRARSPQLRYMPQLKGVCLKTGITKPKKPNSGDRKTARIRLSNGRVITAIIPGEGWRTHP